MNPLLFHFGTAGVVTTLAVGTLFAGPDRPAPDDGHWRLHAIHRTVPVDVEQIKPGILLSFNLSSLPTTRGMVTKMDFFTPDKPAVIVDKYHISWEWSAIPVVVRPGDEIPMTIKGAVSAHPTWENGFVGHCYPLIKAEFWRPGPDEWTHIGGFTQGIVQFSSSDAKNKAGQAKMTGTVPGGSEGDELALVINIEHPAERWDWQYVYTWDSSPFPSDVPDPIPPGQETIPGGGETGPGGEKPVDDEVGPGEEGPGDDDDETSTSGPASLTLEAERRTVNAGGTVTVPIWMRNGRNVGNLDFKVTYDPAVVRPQGKALRGNLLGGASMQSNPADAGRLWIAFATVTRIDGDGTIAQIPFEAVGQPGQKCELGLEVTIFNDSGDTTSITRIPGEIEILTADGRIPGDVNGNGIIDAADAMEALKMAVRLIPMNLAADVDRDGTVTSADARTLLRKAAER